ncbi:MAG: DUF4249 family protein [Bacteroidota bacterium]
MRASIIVLILASFLLHSCEKEIQIDIPGYEEKVVIDGKIETNSPPIVLLSTTKNIYSPTNIDAYMDGFISGAEVIVSDGTTTVVLDEFCTDNLPAGSEEAVSQMLGIPVDQLALFHICAYSTMNTDIWGQVGKSYTLTVNYDGESYTSTSNLVSNTPLNKIFWKPAPGYLDRGYSWGELTDPAGQYDAYLWEVKYLGQNVFYKTYSPVNDDEYFDGKTFEFSYENPMSCGNDDVPEEYRCYYKLNDTVIIKNSKMDRNVYECWEKRYMQLYSSGNPFAAPANVVTNIQGGAIGIWGAYSPWYDTLICVE